MDSSYIMEINKIVVAQICKTIGWNKIKQNSLDLLADVLHGYLQRLANNIRRRAEHCSRTEPILEDVELVFQDMNISWSELIEYMQNVPSVPCPVDVPEFPFKCEPHLNFLKPGSREVVIRPIHIHDHLPPMYPELEEDQGKKLHLPLTAETPPHSSPECNEFKRPRNTELLEIPSTSRIICNTISHEEVGSPLRELSSVIMTTSGFISPAREGKLPESYFNTQSMSTYPTVPPHLKWEHKFKIPSCKISNKEDETNEEFNKLKKKWLANSAEEEDLSYISPNDHQSQGNRIVEENCASSKNKQKLKLLKNSQKAKDSKARVRGREHFLDCAPKKSVFKVDKTIKAVNVEHKITKSIELSSDSNVLYRKVQPPLGISVIPETSLKTDPILNKRKKSEISKIEKPCLEQPSQERSAVPKAFLDNYIPRSHSSQHLMHNRLPNNRPSIPDKFISHTTPTVTEASPPPTNAHPFLQYSEANKDRDSYEDKNTMHQKIHKRKKKDKNKTFEEKYAMMIKNMSGKNKDKCKIKHKHKRKKEENKLKMDDEDVQCIDNSLATKVTDSLSKKMLIKSIFNKPDIVARKDCVGYAQQMKTCSTSKQNLKNERYSQQAIPGSSRTIFSNTIDSKFILSAARTFSKMETKDLPKKVKRETETINSPIATTPISYYDKRGNQVWICPACAGKDNGTPMIGCDGCDAWYHWICVGIKENPDSNYWFCSICADKRKTDY